MAKARQEAQGSGSGSGKPSKAQKQLRKAGNAALQLAQQPIVAELAAAALTAAAASLAAKSKAGKAARREAAELTSDTFQETAAIGSAVKQALLDAARSLLDKYDEGSSGSSADAQEKMLATSDPAEQPRKKKGKKSS